MMDFITNANGKEYQVIAKMQYCDSDNVFLLADYGDKDHEFISAGAEPIQYIVARMWSDITNTWEYAKYYLPLDAYHMAEALKKAKEEFADIMSRIIY